ncbi:subclass B1 metallo-beta-lactamase [Ancylomarina sp. DW003]|nr:subclass B1 metallo-beta-lactamase [Ancylomarina sp. DW003]MDE5421342.1 subclass B1 metallo-beta-lactamase [Ancylomarina sp. DW003]
MGRIVILFSCLIMTVSNLFAQFETKLNEELFLTKLNDTAYVLTHYFPWESNSLIIKASEKEVVLIDTPYDTAGTALIIDWINTNLKPDKISAINTGFHVDNLGGNPYLREKGIDIFGSDRTCELIDEKGKQTQQKLISWLKPEQERIKKVYESMVFVKPNKTFKIQDGITLKIGALTFEVFFPGESHSPDNLIVYIDELDLLFGGCMVKSLSSRNLGFTGDANIAEWPKSMKVVQEKYKMAQIVIPHHGMWGDMSLVQHTINLLENN